MKRILAIDPGLSGGLAYLGASGIILDSMPGTDQDVCILVMDRLALLGRSNAGLGQEIAKQITK